MDFDIFVANRHVLIHSIYSNVFNRCSSYRTNGIEAPDIEIRTNENLLRAEADRISGPELRMLDLSGAEQLVVLRLLTEKILSFDTLLMHGAVVAIDNAAYMFTAKSGTGKTTHIQSWLDHIDGAYVVNGDKPFVIVRKDGEAPLACGSPWAGKENLQTNTIVPLKAIVLQERAEENHMERISFVNAFPFLYQQVYQPDDEGQARKTLRLMQVLGSSVHFWRFQCNNFKDDCFEVAYNALVKDQA